MNDQDLYFNGIDSKGQYLTKPASLKGVVSALLREGWRAPPQWVLRWTQEHAVDPDDKRRKPILDVQHPWDLAETGWAVVYAPDVDRHVKSALGDFLKRRRQAATRDHSNYYRELTYNGESTFEFVRKHGGKPGTMADPDYLPYYVLLVGSPETLPFQFQEELDVNHAVGRIFFDDPQGYANYGASVEKAEDRSPGLPKEAVFFATEHENDPSTRGTAEDLVQFLVDTVLEEGMKWKITPVRGDKARKEKLRALLGGAETPDFLFAACHGVGFEPDDERQEECQGALVCQDWPGPEDPEGIDESQWFSASDVPQDASLRGLIACFYACYGAGTPQRDNFDSQTISRPKAIASRPLVARLPQQLLGRRDGALAVIGHVDRAWTASFSGSKEGEGVNAFRYGLRRLLKGHTVGWSMEYLNQSYAALAAMLGNLEEAWRNRDQVDDELLANLWLVRNDARNFVVFGDPAVRLPGVGDPR